MTLNQEMAAVVISGYRASRIRGGHCIGILVGLGVSAVGQETELRDRARRVLNRLRANCHRRHAKTWADLVCRMTDAMVGIGYARGDGANSVLCRRQLGASACQQAEK